MDQSMVRVGDVEPRYTARGLLSSYSIQVWHDGLSEHRELKSSDIGVLQSKLDAVLAKWGEKWAAYQIRRARTDSAEAALAETHEAQSALEGCEGILHATLHVDDHVDWGALKRHAPFVWKGDQLPIIKYEPDSHFPKAIVAVKRPSAPSERAFAPQLSWYHMFLTGARERLMREAHQQFERAMAEHQVAVEAAIAEDVRRKALLEQQRALFAQAQASYAEECAAANARVDAFRLGVRSRDPDAVVEHAELVLGNSQYPGWHKPDFTIAYSRDSGMLVVDYRLPAPKELPTLEKVTYVKSRDERVEKHIPEGKQRQMFDSVCYQIALRTIHELFEADDANALDGITFNGWVEAVNPATGRTESGCILTVQAIKGEFMTFDLSKVDPKSCFKALKGVAASSLAGLAPVRPLLRLATDDKRFVEGNDVASGLDVSVNLAAMPWEDFEHLVRQLFAKVFSSPGAEVHVTQASRDGGVDAIALDPDPIKGGKIVIQAKRYTGTVTVSAVRDLYGTVVNEGANRGILVTTSDYGPDAYRFAQGKPLTLLNGGNLLSLLSEHGHSARINLSEAREALRNQAIP
jgi:restriction system protein